MAALAVALLACVALAGDASATTTRVFVNGEPVAVFFNDGDSFRMQGGRFAGRQARLGGFNTLESFGPAHQWGEFHPYELYTIAKRATLHARRGTWHCFGDGEQDTYGRVLLDCPDLGMSLIRYGLAHAMEIDDAPTRPEYMRAQQLAIREQRGMWAKGVPELVLTSAHSQSEDPARDRHYNRLVSSRDGHSEEWAHNETYADCDWVCNREVRVDPVAVRATARAARGDAELARPLHDTTNLMLVEFVNRFTRTGDVSPYVPAPAMSPLRSFLMAARERGDLGETETVRGACFLYVDFTRRYGRNRAPCLRGHGTAP